MELLFAIVVTFYLGISFTSFSFQMSYKKHVYNNLPKEKKKPQTLAGIFVTLITAPVFHFFHGLFLVFSYPGTALYDELIKATAELHKLNKTEEKELREKSQAFCKKWFK